MLNILKLKSCNLILAVICFIFSGVVSAEDIRIALRSHHNATKALAQWQPTADYLSKKIPGYRFVMEPFTNISAMNQAISTGDFQFSLTNPSSAIEYIVNYNAEPLATLVNKRQGKGYSEFGSVIFTRSDRKDINRLKDLKGKIFIAVDEQAFGGWRVAWLELLKNRINPFTDFKILRFAGGIQQDVVHAVLDGKAEAGTVRTDMLERMAAKGEINLDDFKIIGEKKINNFPFLLSTDLYPEWLFSTAGVVDEELKNKVIQALLVISIEMPAATKGKYVKWIKPLDYTPVDDLLKKLKVGPYNIATMGAYKRLITQYGMILVTVILVFVSLVLSILYVMRLNKQIIHAKEALEIEMNTTKKLERQLFHSQRIESLGQLTGGIAHDFNNMLASILGFTELALQTESANKDNQLTRYLNQVIQASDKCVALISQMLAFSRTAEVSENKINLSVSNLLNEIHLLLKPILPSSLNLVIKNINKNLYINADPALITQVVMNLYLNAKDALTDEYGTITIGAEVVSFDALDVFCDSCFQDIRGNYIAISVEDNGSGIHEETRKSLFEPFYTTKEVGKGTGMGLSMVHGITHKYGGHVQVESEVGKGTVIKVLLPQADKEENPQISNSNTNNIVSLPGNKNKHIMIVDDEVALTVYLSELLQQQGFRVTSFNNSENALDYFKQHFDEIDLVLTDQTMPNLTGVEMSEKMIECSEDISIILCSGFSEGLEEKIKSGLNISVYMDKPIQSDKLLKMINSLLK